MKKVILHSSLFPTSHTQREVEENNNSINEKLQMWRIWKLTPNFMFLGRLSFSHDEMSLPKAGMLMQRTHKISQLFVVLCHCVMRKHEKVSLQTETFVFLDRNILRNNLSCYLTIVYCRSEESEQKNTESSLTCEWKTQRKFIIKIFMRMQISSTFCSYDSCCLMNHSLFSLSWGVHQKKKRWENVSGVILESWIPSTFVDQHRIWAIAVKIL